MGSNALLPENDVSSTSNEDSSIADSSAVDKELLNEWLPEPWAGTALVLNYLQAKSCKEH